MVRAFLAFAAVALAASLVLAADPLKTTYAPAPQLEGKQLWVFTFSNLAGDAGLKKDIDLMKRAKKAGYTGILVSDTKFDKPQLPWPDLAGNCKKFRQACTDEKMLLIAGVTPFGYCDNFLTHDPNLAEGMPVRKAVFVVKDGKLVPDAEGVELANPSFEAGNMPVGAWWILDKACSLDVKVVSDGNNSLLMDNPGVSGKDAVCRAWQKIKVQPWHYYHVSVMVKTENWTGKDMRILAHVGNPDGKGWELNFQPLDLKPTMDWTRMHATFSSREFTDVSIYLGTWAGKTGKIWWDDVKIEPGGFVNLLRRDSLPLAVASEDGKTTYQEGKDFSETKDAKLFNDPNPGYFTLWHDAPAVTIPDGSKLKDGQKVLVSYHVAMPAGKPGQVNMCMTEPKVYPIVEGQIKWMKENVAPDVYLLGHDEIREGGWDDSCVKSGKTPGEILAMNVQVCAELIKKHDPGKPIVAWNDMFDPFHNAKDKGAYYLVKGDGPWSGSWKGLSSDVIVANWRQNKPDSMKFFADRGHQQLLAGYYDHDPKAILDWLKTAKDYKNVMGVIYTTWKGEYKDLETFAKYVKGFESGSEEFIKMPDSTSAPAGK